MIQIFKIETKESIGVLELRGCLEDILGKGKIIHIEDISNKV